ADEKIRIKTLSLGVVVPDITFELAKRNEDMYLFSPYDVERVYGVPFTEVSVTEQYYDMVDDARISKSTISDREFCPTLVAVPVITFELAKRNEDMYRFSPYDWERVYGVPFTEISVTEKYYEMVDDARISKSKISAREFFQTLAEIQFESGYPYIMFEDTVN